MADGQPQYHPGQYLGTASAPVSRIHSTEEQFTSPVSPIRSHQDSSPPSSEGTAVNDNNNNNHDAPGVRFATVQDGNAVHDISLPAPPRNEEELRRALGSASAPASPGASGSHQQPQMSALKKSETLPEPHSAQQPALFASESHPDPAVAAGLLPSSAAESQPAGITGSHSAPHSRRTSRPHSPSAGGGRRSPHTAKWPHAFSFPHHHNQGNYYGRGSHQAQHSKPLYSLARPLPTREQRDMQKAYRDSIKAHVGPGARHSTATTPNRSHNGSQVNLVGPGAHHPPYFPYMAPVPGAIPPYGGGHAGQPYGQQGGTGSDDKIMLMLRKILEQQQGNKSNEGSSKDIDREDIRDDDDPAAALARKEGFGESREAKDAIKDKTARAERRDSLSSHDSDFSDLEAEYPNPWARFRHALREPFAEFLGTMLLVMFGTGVSLQYFLSLDPNVVSSPRGTYLSVSFGWGIGVGIGVWVAGGISGGHINPAVTLALAVFRGFPWKKVPGYILAQILGSTAGAGLNYAMYRRAISIFEGGGNIRTISGPTATASLFSTYPLDYVTDANAFFQEFINTAILLITVLAISDSNNAAPPDGLNPLVLLFLIVGIGACFGMQTAYCINPARDIGPRLVTWWAGYGKDVWDFRNQYWLWVTWCATISGGLMGCVIYDMLIYTGSESPINMKWDWPWRKKSREGFGPASKEKMPLGQTEP
ncbi:aquaporin [Cystobasidium minutum MCA 4210]|uniref:aquaporin n=1 Tax=Cystobasidium minutum MCA 4210 TaxID=1397322 RepID=UPI0034CD81B4|eukprot:jgi/Rhomi1/35211/CE35210_7444